MLIAITIAFSSHGSDSLAEQKEQLRKRCFVWSPSLCNEDNRKADEKLVRSLTIKLTSAQAVDKILVEGWDAIGKDNDPITAIYRFNQALILEPNTAQAWWGAGAGYLILDMPLDSEPLIKKALQIDPNLKGAHLSLARCYAHLGRIPEGRAEYETAKHLGATKDKELERLLK